jgi:AcrR family transcriptional regulator
MGRPPLISREALLEAAREVFVSGGLHASIHDVAIKSGISEAAVFKRFSSKAELIVAAMAPRAPDVMRLLAPLDEGDLHQGLVAVMQNILGYFREALPVMLPIIAQPDVGLERFLDQVDGNAAATLNSALAAKLAAAANSGRISLVKPFAAAGLIVATAHSIVLFEIMGLHGGATPPAVLEAMIDTLWRGLHPG